MNVANLENCKQLYKLSKWGHFISSEPMDNWCYGDDIDEPYILSQGGKGLPTNLCPAYPAGYLLRKLPKALYYKDKNIYLVIEFNPASDNTIVCYMDDSYQANHVWWAESDTPEDALCMLAIRLWEEGILK